MTMRKKENIDALLSLYEDLAQAERDRVGKEVSEEAFEKILREGTRTSSSVLADEAGTMVGKAKDLGPNFTMPKGGDVVLREATDAVPTGKAAEAVTDLVPARSRDIVSTARDVTKTPKSSMLGKVARGGGKLLGLLSPFIDTYFNPANEGSDVADLDRAREMMESEVAKGNLTREEGEAQLERMAKINAINRGDEREVLMQQIQGESEDAIPFSTQGSSDEIDTMRYIKELDLPSEEEIDKLDLPEDSLADSPEVDPMKPVQLGKLDVKGERDDDSDLSPTERAIRDRNRTQALAMLVKGLGQIGGALVQQNVGATNAPVNIDVDPLMKMAEQKVSDVGMLEAEKLRDPASEASKAYREQITALGVKVPESMSAADLKKMFPQLISMQQSQMNRELREKMMERRLTQDEKREAQRVKRGKELRQKDLFNAARSRLKDDGTYKEIKKQQKAFDEVESLLESGMSGNQLATAGLGTRLARAMGEVGVLTDADVIRYLKGSSYGRQITDWLSLKGKGKLSRAAANELSKNIQIFRDAAKRQTDKLYDTTARSVSSSFEIPQDEVYKILGVDKPEEKKEQKRELSPRDQQALEWAQKNPEDRRAKKILQRFGM